MNDETRQTEIQTQILQKSSIIVDRFPVYVITLHMRNHTLWQIEHCQWSHGLFFCRSRWKRCYVVIFLDLLSFIYCVGCSAAGVFEKIQTLCTCMNETRVRCACDVRQYYLCKIVRIPWKFFQRINIFCILLIAVSFILSYNFFTTICSLCI